MSDNFQKMKEQNLEETIDDYTRDESKLHEVKFAGGEQVKIDEETGVMLAAHIQKQMMDETDK